MFRVRAAIEHPRSRALVSAAVAWDIALKESLGKLRFARKAAFWLPPAVEESGFTWLPIEPKHALGNNSVLRGAGELIKTTTRSTGSWRRRPSISARPCYASTGG